MYCGSTGEAWSGDEARSGGLGGSETNAGELAAALAARGFSVVLSGNVADGVHDGVHYLSEAQLRLTDADGKPQFDHVIISRVVQQFTSQHALAARRGIYLWVQDLFPHMSPYETSADTVARLLTRIAPQLTRVLALSPSHAAEMREAFPALHAQHTRLWSWMPNAIDPVRWTSAEAAFEAAGESKIRRRFIYTSTPERGLLHLMRLFPRIRQAIPEATLVVATYSTSGVTPEMHHLMEQASGHITFLGRLSKDALYREILRSEVWLYPTTFKETYCNTALEMMMGRVLAVGSDWGALHDWLGHGRGMLLPMKPGDAQYGGGIGEPVLDVHALVKLLEDEPRLQAKLTKARRWAEAQTWTKRSAQWAKLFAEGQVDGSWQGNTGATPSLGANSHAAANEQPPLQPGAEGQPQQQTRRRYRDSFGAVFAVAALLMTILLRWYGLV